MSFMQTKIIILPKNIKILFVYLNMEKFLVFKKFSNVKYVSMPLTSLCNKIGEQLIFSCNSNDVDVIARHCQLVERLNSAIKTLNSKFRKKLILKGLGFRIFINEKNLEFKLGFSHLIQIIIPKNLNVKVKKNFIYLESNNRILLGNFMNKIISLKSPDSYKGKGFWYKYQEKTLKALKKK